MKKLYNQIFGRWTVVGQEPIIAPDRKNKKWQCKCECGSIKYVYESSLLNGSSTSCGCKAKELSSQRRLGKADGNRRKENNEVEFCGDYIKIYNYNKSKFFIIDTDDYDKIKNFRWNKAGSKWYAHIYVDTKDDNILKYSSCGKLNLYRFLLSTNDTNVIIDHINGNTDDNRKENLRKVTKQQNALNKNIRSNSSTKINGVSFSKLHNKYEAYISKDGHRFNLGLYNSIDEASYARYYVEKLLYDDFSPIKSRSLSIPYLEESIRSGIENKIRNKINDNIN